MIESYTTARCQFDFAARTFRVDGRNLKLHKKAADLLHLLVQNCEVVVTHSHISTHLRGSGLSETLERAYSNTNANRLLKRLGDNKLVESVAGVGYRWRHDIACGSTGESAELTVAVPGTPFDALGIRHDEAEQPKPGASVPPAVASFDNTRGAGPAVQRAPRMYRRRLSTHSLVGRQSEFESIKAELHPGGVVTIVGPGGVGKTRLATTVADDWVRQDRDCAFIPLEGLTTDEPEELGQFALDALAIAPVPSGDIIEALAGGLPKSTLIVLDSCESAAKSAAPFVAALLDRREDLCILATSIRPVGLSPREIVCRLEPLAIPGSEQVSLESLERCDSFILFRTGAARAGAKLAFDASSVPSVLQILHLTEGLPLAIELVAAAVPYFALERIAFDLQSAPLGGVTDSDSVEDTVGVGRGRHRSLRRCLEWAFNHLAPDEQEMLATIAIFEGTFTEEAIEHVCSSLNVRRVITRLLRSSHLVREPDAVPTRYYMLRLVREFSSQKALELGLSAHAAIAHARYFEQRANMYLQVPRARRVQLDYDWRDMVEAALRAARTSLRSVAWRMNRVLKPYLMDRGLLALCEKVGRNAITLAFDAENWTEFQFALQGVAEVQEARGDWTGALKAYEKVYRSAVRSRNNLLAVQCLQKEIGLLEKLGQGDQARVLRRQLQEVSSMPGPIARAIALDAYGSAQESEGQLDEARQQYLEALHLRREHNNRLGIGISFQNLASNAVLRGDWDEAETWYLRAVELHCEDADRVYEARARTEFGSFLQRRGRVRESIDQLLRALTLREGDERGRAVTLGYLARSYRSLRDWERAESSAREAVAVAQSVGFRQTAVLVLDELGAQFTLRKRWDDAEQCLRQSIRIREQGRIDGFDDPLGLGIAFDRLAHLHLLRGNTRSAREAIDRSILSFRSASRSFEEARALINLAHIFAASGDRDGAVSALRDVQSRSDRRVVAELRPHAVALELQLVSQMIPGTPWRLSKSLSYVRALQEIRSKCPPLVRELNPDEAARIYADLVSEFAQASSPEEQAIALNELCGVQRKAGRFEEAECSCNAALRLFEKLHHRLGIAASYHKLGDLYTDWEHYAKAEVAYRESISIKQSLSDGIGEAITRSGLSRMQLSQGLAAAALVEARRANELVAASGTVMQKWVAMRELVECLLAVGDVTAANRVVADAAVIVGGKRPPDEIDSLRSRVQFAAAARERAQENTAISKADTVRRA